MAATAMSEKFQVAISLQPVVRSTSCFVLGWGLGDGGSNGAIFDLNEFKMAAAAILVISNGHISQRITIYRAVIFVIAQLSCLSLTVNISKTVADTAKVTIND